MDSRSKLNIVVAAMIVLCAVGTWVSGRLLMEHVGPWPTLESTAVPFQSNCGGLGGEPASCETVTRGRLSAVDITIPTLGSGWAIHWSRVVIPIAFTGLAYFLFLGIWFSCSGSHVSWTRSQWLVPLVVTIGGAVASVGLVLLMVFKIRAWCDWCLATHAINTVLVFGMVWLWRQKREPRRSTVIARRARMVERVIGRRLSYRVGGFAVLVIAAAWIHLQAKLETRRQVANLLPYKKFVKDRSSDPAFLLREFYAQPRMIVASGADREAVSSVHQTPTVDIFTDSACRTCGCFASRWRNELRSVWHGSLIETLRPISAGGDCANAGDASDEASGCGFAYAVEAARLQGGDEAAWRMNELLFARRRHAHPRSRRQIAEKLGMDGERFVDDMSSNAVRRKVERDTELATRLGVHGTPAVFLNGREVPLVCLNNPIFWEAVSTSLASDWSEGPDAMALGAGRDQTGVDFGDSQ